MLYSLKNKFLVQNVLCEVRYLNNDMAWVFPVDDTPGSEGRMYLACVSFEVLNENGLDRKGNKAISVNESPSGAV